MEVLFGQLMLNSTVLSLDLVQFWLAVVSISLLPFQVNTIDIDIGHQAAFSTLYLDWWKLLLDP